MTAIRDLIKRGCSQIGRRMSIKRIDPAGNYESSWFDISDYVIGWGSYGQGFGDSAYVGEYQINGTTVVLNNGRRKFNVETDSNSFFYHFGTRFLTKFKIELFFIDDDDAEVAGLTWYGILYGEPETSDDGTINMDLSSMLKVFQLFPASGIGTTSQTTGAVITSLLIKTQNGTRIFDRYFEGATDAARYSVNPDADTLKIVANLTISDSDTVWDVMKRMSLYENYFIYVNSSGNIVWTSRDATATSQFNFNGAGSFGNEDAINIISIDKESSGFNNIWNRVVTTYFGGSTVVAASTTWVPGDGSTQSKYGEKTYELTAEDLSLAVATVVGLSFYAEYQESKREWDIKTILIPHLNVKDLVTLSYIGELLTTNTFTLGVSLLGGTDVLGVRGGSINLKDVSCKIIDMSVNVDDLSCDFKLREV